MLTSPLPADEFIARRKKLAKELGDAAAVVFAGDHAAPKFGRWEADLNFSYLTGMDNEPGAAVLFDPSVEDPKRRIVLLLRPLNPELEKWDGFREQIGTAMKRATGFETIQRTTALPMLLTAALRRTKKAACLLPFSIYPAAASADLAAFQQVAQRVPGVSIQDRTALLVGMRAIKSAAEVKLTEQAVAITAAAYGKMYAALRPGNSEAQVALALEQGYRGAGGDHAYNPIVAGGFNGTVLHYNDNNRPLRAGELLVIDSAARFGGYCADVTRTYPVGGKFSPAQREVYRIVLAALHAGIRAARPGARMLDIDAAARSVIDKAGFADAFIHGIGHPLGLHVHDVNPEQPIKPGMILTIEPGIYLPDQKLGVRIEDDVLITPKGNKNLTAMIPKEIAEVEKVLA
jgi:Xaa-Pro aminopeptidase